MIHEALRSHLISDSGVVALVGSKIYAHILPQAVVLPAITYQLISAPVDETHDGDGTLYFTRFQLRCWARKRPGEAGYTSAKQLGEAVKEAMRAWDQSTPVAIGSPVTETVQRVHLVNELDGGFDPDPESISVILDYQIDYNKES